MFVNKVKCTYSQLYLLTLQNTNQRKSTQLQKHFFKIQQKLYKTSPNKNNTMHNFTHFLKGLHMFQRLHTTLTTSLQTKSKNQNVTKVYKSHKKKKEEIFQKINKQNLYKTYDKKQHIKSIKEKTIKLDAAVAELKKSNLNYHFDNFPNASHYSLVLYAIPKALYHIFGIYQPISVNEYNEKIAVLPSGYVDYLNKKYETIEKLLALKTRIRFNDFKAIEAAIIKNKAYDEFGELSNLAEKQYPKSMLANYELALMYEYTGDFQKARKYYQAAYEREEIGNLTQDMMYDKMEKMKNAKAPTSTDSTPEMTSPEQKP